MKIKEIDKEQKKINMKYIMPIIQSGLGLGITCFLIKTGVLNYNNLANLDKVKDTFNSFPMHNLPFFDIYMDTVYELIEKVINTIGIQGIAIAGKSFGFASKIVKPILDSHKIKENPETKKIKRINKAKYNSENLHGEKKNKKGISSILKIAQEGLAIGATAYMIGTGQIDYNSIYKFENLPHKLSFIGNIAKNIDFNKVKIGKITVESIMAIVNSKKKIDEKINSDINPKKFSNIIHKISREGELPGFSAWQEYRRMFLLNELGEKNGYMENNIEGNQNSL